VRSRTTTVEVTAAERYGYLDLTDDLRRAIKDSGVTEGAAIAFCEHTTAALLINEWEEGAMADFRTRLETLVPGDVDYAHDDLTRRTQNLEETHERPNGRSHVGQMLLGQTSHAIPVAQGEPMLGRWQRLMLIELDEPKPVGRSVVFHVFGE
jgi:secondary thiamine-phosphate synthase enzyme